jgi:hypothetical protein
MPNRRLTTDEFVLAIRLLNSVRQRLLKLAEGDGDLLFAYRRKVYKELSYDERGKPAKRKQLKRRKWREQGGVCPLCGKRLRQGNGELDRLVAAPGYTPENTRLIHRACHIRDQRKKGYT